MATLAFSPDGKTLASGTERTVKLWEVATGQERITLKRGARILAFSPDGNTLGVGVRGQVLLLPALTDPAALARNSRPDPDRPVRSPTSAARTSAPTPNLLRRRPFAFNPMSRFSSNSRACSSSTRASSPKRSHASARWSA